MRSILLSAVIFAAHLCRCGEEDGEFSCYVCSSPITEECGKPAKVGKEPCPRGQKCVTATKLFSDEKMVWVDRECNANCERFKRIYGFGGVVSIIYCEECKTDLCNGQSIDKSGQVEEENRGGPLFQISPSFVACVVFFLCVVVLL